MTEDDKIYCAKRSSYTLHEARDKNGYVLVSSDGKPVGFVPYGLMSRFGPGTEDREPETVFAVLP